MFSIFVLVLSFFSAQKVVAGSQLDELEGCARRAYFHVVDKRIPYDGSYRSLQPQGLDRHSGLTSIIDYRQSRSFNAESSSYESFSMWLKNRCKAKDGASWNVTQQDGTCVNVANEDDLAFILIFSKFSHYPSFKMPGVKTLVIFDCEWLSDFARFDAFPDLTDFHVMDVPFCWSHVSSHVRQRLGIHETTPLFLEGEPEKNDSKKGDLVSSSAGSVSTVFAQTDRYAGNLDNADNLFPGASRAMPNPSKVKIFLSKRGQHPCNTPELRFQTAFCWKGLCDVTPTLSETAAAHLSSQKASLATDDSDWSETLDDDSDLSEALDDDSDGSEVLDDDSDWSEALQNLFKEQTGILSLPFEMIQEIFSHLTPAEALPLVCVRHSWEPALRCCQGTWGVMSVPYSICEPNKPLQLKLLGALGKMYNTNQSELVSDVSLGSSQSGVFFQVTQTVTVIPLWRDKEELVKKPPLASKESVWSISSKAIAQLSPKAFKIDLAWRVKDQEAEDQEAASVPFFTAGPLFVTTEALTEGSEGDLGVLSKLMMAVGICEFEQIIGPSKVKKKLLPEPDLKKEEPAVEDPCDDKTPVAVPGSEAMTLNSLDSLD